MFSDKTVNVDLCATTKNVEVCRTSFETFVSRYATNSKRITTKEIAYKLRNRNLAVQKYKDAFVE